MSEVGWRKLSTIFWQLISKIRESDFGSLVTFFHMKMVKRMAICLSPKCPVFGSFVSQEQAILPAILTLQSKKTQNTLR